MQSNRLAHGPMQQSKLFWPPTPQLCTRIPDSTSYGEVCCVQTKHKPMQGKGERERWNTHTVLDATTKSHTHTRATSLNAEAMSPGSSNKLHK